MAVIVTAKSGEVLREYAETKKGNSRIAIFPESGMSPKEQASYLINNIDMYDEIITFSSFIISDALNGKLVILDKGENNSIKHGDSVNKIIMKLGQENTIGNIASNKIDDYRNKISLATTEDEISSIIQTYIMN